MTDSFIQTVLNKAVKSHPDLIWVYIGDVRASRIKRDCFLNVDYAWAEDETTLYFDSLCLML